MNLKPVARRLWRYTANYRALLLGSVACFLLGSAVEPAVPWLFKKLLDGQFQQTASFPLWMVPVAVIGLFMIRGLFSFSGSYLLNRASASIIMKLRQDLMSALLKADARLFSNLSPGIAISKVINDPANTFGALNGALTTILRDSTAFIFLLAYLIYLNWKLTLLAMVVLPGMVFMVRRLHKRLKRVGGLEYESAQRLTTIVDDGARAWRVIRTFDAADFEAQRFAQESRTLRGLTIKRNAASALMTPLTQIVAAIGVSIILTLALWQARQGQATIGEFVSFITALLMTISPMRHLTDVSQPILNSLIVAKGCFEFLDTPPERDPGTLELEHVQGLIEFKNVTVSYDNNVNPALDKVSLIAQPHQTIALVGSSGSGKTTLINTLLGFVSPQSGRIELDGHDIESLTRKSLRSHFAVVSQDIVLFDDSIAQNVAYSQTIDEAKIISCLKASNLLDFVNTLPQGIFTPIGTNGSKLSGGQRQRLAIARALYKDSAVWIFDEATSALDTESERIVQQSIEQWAGKRTLILIAHRLSTVRRADQIYVLANGRVAESGTDEQLRALNGMYASMVNAQQLHTPHS